MNEIQHNFFVDDFWSSFQNEDTLIKTTHQVQQLLLQGDLELAKWQASSPRLLQAITEPSSTPSHLEPPSASSVADNSPPNSDFKVLGVSFCAKKDCFLYSLSHFIASWPTKVLTKRKMLSCIQSIFDPMGLMGPYTTRLRVLNQQSWLVKTNDDRTLDWDDNLPTELLQSWAKEVEKLNSLPPLLFPRHVNFDLLHDPRTRLEFIISSDASELLYAAVIHVRIFYSAGEGKTRIKTTLLTSKSRVAPVKQLTIPRLELLGMLVGTKLFTNIKKQLQLPDEWLSRCTNLFLTDSAIALYWLSNDISKLNDYCKNRVTKSGS